jgi:hypothetical protein
LEVLPPYEMSSDIPFASFVPSAAFTMSNLMSASASFLATTPKPTARASGSTTRCGASTPPTRRPLPVQHDLTTPRARARAARLRENEAAERREDLAALVTTPVSHHLLSFCHVSTDHPPLLPPCPLPLQYLVQNCMTDVALPVLGTMGAFVPLVRRRKNGIR